MLKSVTINTTNMNDWRKYKAIYASDMVLVFFQSEYFKEKLLSINLKELKGEAKNSITKGMNNTQLYEHIMSGKEVWNNDVDYNIDLIITWYKKIFSSVVGYIIPGKKTLYVNGKFFDSMSALKVASNMAHEWIHLVGVYHINSGPFLRDSLAYFINTWIEDFYSHRGNDDIPPIKEYPKYETHCKRSWRTLFFKKCYTRIVS